MESATYLSPLSLWLALCTISLASRCSVANLEQPLMLPGLLPFISFGWHSPLLGWSFYVFPSLQQAISTV